MVMVEPAQMVRAQRVPIQMMALEMVQADLIVTVLRTPDCQ